MSTSWGCFSWSVLCHQYLFTSACPAVAPMALPLNTKEPCQRILEIAPGTQSLRQSFAGKRFCRKEFVPFVRHELGSVGLSFSKLCTQLKQDGACQSTRLLLQNWFVTRTSGSIPRMLKTCNGHMPPRCPV